MRKPKRKPKWEKRRFYQRLMWGGVIVILAGALASEKWEIPGVVVAGLGFAILLSAAHRIDRHYRCPWCGGKLVGESGSPREAVDGWPSYCEKCGWRVREEELND